jgi:hypothetical protein
VNIAGTADAANTAAGGFPAPASWMSGTSLTRDLCAEPRAPRLIAVR